MRAAAPSASARMCDALRETRWRRDQQSLDLRRSRAVCRLLVGHELDEPLAHLLVSDLDRVLLASLDERNRAANQLTNALLKQGGLVERAADRILKLLRERGGHGGEVRGRPRSEETQQRRRQRSRELGRRESSETPFRSRGRPCVRLRLPAPAPSVAPTP